MDSDVHDSRLLPNRYSGKLTSADLEFDVRDPNVSDKSADRSDTS